MHTIEITFEDGSRAAVEVDDKQMDHITDYIISQGIPVNVGP